MPEVVFVTRKVDYPIFKLSFASFARNLEGTRRFVVVVPDGEGPFFERLALPDTTVYEESALHPSLRGWQHEWYKQQLVKLWVDRVMLGEHALVVDSDVFLTRPTSGSELLGGEPAKFFVKSFTGPGHPRWIDQAAIFLRHQPTRRISFHPTPNVVSRRVLLGLRDYLSRLHGGTPFDVMKQHLGSYTEWATYGMYLAELLPDGATVQPLQLAEPLVSGVWSERAFASWPASQQPSALLLVVQSVLELRYRDYAGKIEQLPGLASLGDDVSGPLALVIRPGAPLLLWPTATSALQSPLETRTGSRQVLFEEHLTALPEELAADSRLAFRISDAPGGMTAIIGDDDLDPA